MIVRSGFKVFPSEIENLFIKHPCVEACAVVGIQDDVDVNVPKACVVLKEGYKDKTETVETELLEMFENSTLPPYFRPKSSNRYMQNIASNRTKIHILL